MASTLARTDNSTVFQDDAVRSFVKATLQESMAYSPVESIFASKFNEQLRHLAVIALTRIWLTYSAPQKKEVIPWATSAALFNFQNLLSADMDKLSNSRITMIPGLCGGRPTIRGMRIRVIDVLDLLAAGASREEILEDYPYLEDADITAVLEYSSAQISHNIIAAE